MALTQGYREVERPALTRAGMKLRAHWRRYVLAHRVADDADRPQPVALMVPVAPKDAARARRSIPLMQANIAHPLVRTVIAAPDDPGLRALAEELGADFVDEAPVLAGALGAERVAGMRGWLRQQFLKLLAPQVAGHDHVVSIDSDTLLNRRTAWLTPDGRAILHCAQLTAEPYQEFARALIGPFAHRCSSFIAHSALFRAGDLASLQAAVEARAGRPWLEAIDALNARPELGRMSEFELLARHMERDRPRDCAVRYYAGATLTEDQFFGRAPVPAWKRKYRFLSNHDHIG